MLRVEDLGLWVANLYKKGLGSWHLSCVEGVSLVLWGGFGFAKVPVTSVYPLFTVLGLLEGVMQGPARLTCFDWHS